MAKTYLSDNSQQVYISNIRVAIETDLILTETEKESTNKDTTTQETIADTKMIIMITTVLGTGNMIADVMRETIFPQTTTKSHHVETTLQ